MGRVRTGRTEDGKESKKGRGDIEGIHKGSEDEVVGKREGSFRLKYKDREMDRVETENTNAKHQARLLSYSLFSERTKKRVESVQPGTQRRSAERGNNSLGVRRDNSVQRRVKKGCFINTPASQEVSNNSSSARHHP